MDELDYIINQIVEKTGMSKEDIMLKINAKEEEFGGMVSTVGAAYIVAKELGLDIVKPLIKELKIKDVTEDMNKINIIGKVVYVSEVRNFKKGDLEGSVATVIIGDETGKARISLWNEQTEVLDRLEPGMVIEVINGHSKSKFNDMVDIRIGKFGNIRILEKDKYDIEVKDVSIREYKDKDIYEFEVGDFVKVKGYIDKMFEKAVIYEVCPVCNKRVEDNKCEEHGVVEPKYNMIVSGILDDGLNTITFNAFGDNVEKLTGMKIDEMKKMIDNEGVKKVYDSWNLEGRLFVIKGVVRYSDFMNRKELNVISVLKPDVVGLVSNELKNYN